MALLRHLIARKVTAIQPVLCHYVARQAGGYPILDNLPGPYPKNEKERLAAAKKYGLLPEEYTPIADDGFGKGDYPDLPDIGASSKDPNYPWDYPEFKLNYGEVWHINSDMYTEDRADPQADWHVPKHVMIGMLFGVVGGFFLIYYLLSPYRVHRPVCRKQFPNQGKVHYGFERSH